MLITKQIQIKQHPYNVAPTVLDGCFLFLIYKKQHPIFYKNKLIIFTINS